VDRHETVLHILSRTLRSREVKSDFCHESAPESLEKKQKTEPYSATFEMICD